MARRRYVNLTIAEWARMHGVSAKTARARIAKGHPHAYKQSGRWVVPTLQTESKRAGYSGKRSYSANEHSKYEVRVLSDTASKSLAKLRESSVKKYMGMLGIRDRMNETTIRNRFKMASREQLIKILTWNDHEFNIEFLDVIESDFWKVADDGSLLYYH